MDERGFSRRRFRRPQHAARGERVRLHRVFFALWPDTQFVQTLGALEKRILARVEGRRLAVENWHVTVCFLGAVNEAALVALQASAAAVSVATFSLRFDRIEYWPEVRVVVATAQEVPAAATELSFALRALARSLGLSPDESPLRPHVTLMRGVNPLAWQMNRDCAGTSLESELTFVAEALHLAESRPAPRRDSSEGLPAGAAAPSYVRLASWPLQR